MKVVCVGAGPAGLYLSVLLKLRDKDCDVSVFERNAAGCAEGWGIISTGSSLVQRMHANDPVSASMVLEHSTKWIGQALRIKGRTTTYPRTFGYSINRNRFLEILAARAAELGVEIHYQSKVTSLDKFAAADLIVASDGAGSTIRDEAPDAFGTKIRYGRNKYIWLGATKVFGPFTFSVEETDAGWIWFHGYPHNTEMSTCVVECSPETWSGLGFDKMDTERAIRELERIFANVLEDGNLVGGGSKWHNFRTVINRTWHRGKVVLVGDAAHTAHFSLGSGTRFAIEDAISLSKNLFLRDSVEQALVAYEKERMRVLRRFQRDAKLSASWFENIGRYLSLPDREVFTLLLNRRSPALARIPPHLYYRFRRLVERVPLLNFTRAMLFPRARTARMRFKR